MEELAAVKMVASQLGEIVLKEEDSAAAAVPFPLESPSELIYTPDVRYGGGMGSELTPLSRVQDGGGVNAKLHQFG